MKRIFIQIIIRLIKFQISQHFKLTPWNVDTISHDKFAKTIINKEEPKKTDEQLTEEERAQRYVRTFLLNYYSTAKTCLHMAQKILKRTTCSHLTLFSSNVIIESNWIEATWSS